MFSNRLFLFNNLRNNLLIQGKGVNRLIYKSIVTNFCRKSNVFCVSSCLFRVQSELQLLNQSRLLHTNPSLWSGKLVPFNLSDIGEGISEVVIKEWFIKTGDEVNQFDSICEVQSDKASVTITSRYDGVIEKIYYDIDDIAKVGKPLVDIRLKEDGKEGLVQADQVDQVADLEANQICDSQPTNVLDWKGDKVLTTPAVRRIASENNLRLSEIKGTGRDGRILKEDLLKFIDTSKSLSSSLKSEPSFVEKNQPFEKTATKNVAIESVKVPESDKSIPFTIIQRAMFKSMTQSLRIPHFGLSDEVDLSNLLHILPQLREQAAAKEIRLTFMPIFIKALSIALSDYPLINSSIDEKNERVILKSSHNIGFAMDTKDGLIVPNIKNVESLSIIEIAQEMKRLQQDGANNKLRREDASDGTITLSNIGSIGGLFGIPVIPPSQVVIGAIGQMKTVPIFNEKDEIVKANIVNILWSADHRTIDGATLCRFSSSWKSLLQDPIKMLTEMK